MFIDVTISYSQSALSQVRRLCKGILKFQVMRTVPGRKPVAWANGSVENVQAEKIRGS